MSILSDLQESEARSKALLEASRTDNSQIANSLQSARGAISAIQNAETAQFNDLAAKGPGQPLRDALLSIQDQRTAEFNRIGRQLNVAAGLPATSPHK